MNRASYRTDRLACVRCSRMRSRVPGAKRGRAASRAPEPAPVCGDASQNTSPPARTDGLAASRRVRIPSAAFGCTMESVIRAPTERRVPVFFSGGAQVRERALKDSDPPRGGPESGVEEEAQECPSGRLCLVSGRVSSGVSRRLPGLELARTDRSRAGRESERPLPDSLRTHSLTPFRERV